MTGVQTCALPILSNPWVLTRRTDNDESDEFVGANLFIAEGTVNADKKFVCTTNSPVTVGTTDITFTVYSSLESLTAGTGLNKSGSEVRIGISGTTGNINGINRTSNDISAAVDDLSIGIVSNVLTVKALGINTAELADDSVTAAKLNLDVAGDGLAQGVSGELDVVGGNGITVNANDINVTPGDLISGGSAEIDGDKLDIDWNPTNYTPATTPSEVTSVDELTAHLYGIDQALASTGDGYKAEKLAYTDTTNKVIGPLASTPANLVDVGFTPYGGPIQEESVDYTCRQVIGGSVPGYYICISSTSTAPGSGSFSGGANPSAGIDSIMQSADKSRVEYSI